MLTFLWKFTGYSQYLKKFGTALKPVFDNTRIVTMMAYPRGPGGPPTRRSYHDDYNYEYDCQRGPMQQPFMPGRWPGPVHPAMNIDVEKPVDANCGELRLRDRGITVHMTGRVQYQRLNRFICLRDSHGTTQLVALEERLDLIKRIRNIPLDSHIEIIGLVERRPANTINTTMATGEIEVIINEILDVAAPKRKLYEPSGEEVAGRTGKKARSSILITSGEIAHCGTEAVRRRFLQRSHNCGELNESKVNMDVTLCGWIESKRNERFVVLRDGYGAAQLVINPIDFAVSRVVQNAEPNTLLTVRGRVSMRPSHQRNTRMATGNIEVKVSSVEIIDPNEPVTDDMLDVSSNKMELQEPQSNLSSGDVNSYCERTHTCGQLRGSDVGKDVVLCGWLASQRTNRFATIRDGHGTTQLLIPTTLEPTLGKILEQTTLESVIKVTGTVCARPPEQVTDKLATGEVEVVLKDFILLNPAKKEMPFLVREHNRPKEPLRMKYRYIDLRFSDMQYRLRLRSRVLMKMREFLINQRGFTEVETPTLFRRTPGGAQEYIVPTRTEDRFYSLVQSPQQLKQLLMVGAMDRYFQVARCYRDEGARPDRQPEFTQMDIELSFTDRDSILSLVEELLKASWPEELKTLHTPFPVLTYHDAMHSYGSDKPDLSFDKKLTDINGLISGDKKMPLPQNPQDVGNFTAKALVIGSNDNVSKLNSSFKECEELLKSKSKAKLFMVKCGANNWRQAMEASLTFVNVDQLKDLLDLSMPCTVVVGIGKDTEVLPLMGKLRQDVFSNPTSNFHFAWIVDFPLFLEGEDGSLESAHHPFTSAHPQDVHLLNTNPLKVRGLHFDLVLNGFEVGGGSIRIHNPEVQFRVLNDILKLPINSLEHLLEALASGAPPHGGIALGMDRLLSIMVGAESIRDVIAFPKGVDGKDPLCGAPCSIPDFEKRLYHLIPRKD
ncbi:aspartate--tRNA ligase, mitochondrial isoform X2 [Homalodisca vitripennis]|uniref:aspartate--tRNA ligase, mitochondrial isoform X2 n=1 Tax=Homalodisca vitripennis TaxID=197043 RepID=UPI001EEB5471|nr:aspartate--tRNA ligase, mitochondrial isoform X2 [Homalodisca vitripennis]